MPEIEALEKFLIFDLTFSSCSASSKTPKSKFLARLDELLKNNLNFTAKHSQKHLKIVVKNHSDKVEIF